ncbi:hypothetical protein AYK24_03280 [Thermoplasmatales archaeon SG8-52-4]|nr:MAG: hypothetical protein AYK24_03280 [Thermoplasmatales archaeon SG8-52-4]
MNIGLLIGQTFVGGMERQAAYLSKGFIDNGHRTFVYIATPNISFKKRSKVKFPKEITFRLWGTRYTLTMTKLLLIYYCKKHNIDVLIGFQVGAIEICNYVKASLKFPTVIGNIRGIKFMSDHKLKIRYQNACNQLDGIITNSNAVLQLIKDHVLTNNTIPAEMIPNIVHVPSWKYKESDDKFIVLFAASLTKVKDPLVFLKSICIATKKNQKISVLIAGNGPLKQEMEDYIKKENLASKIKFLGSVKPEKVPYNQAHLVISTSLREASSNTILEALAHGICVIGTNVGGTTELLENKPFGRLIDPGDYHQLAIEILQFCKLTQEEMRSNGEEAQKFIKDNFKKQQIIDKYLNFIRQVKSAKLKK